MFILNGKKINSLIVGNTVPDDQTATSEDIRLGKTASVNGEKITGEFVPLDKADIIKQLIDVRRTAAYLFAGREWNEASNITDDVLEECLKFDTTENVYYISNMFDCCTKIVNIPSFSTKSLKGNGATRLFRGCWSMIEPPMLDLGVLAEGIELFLDCRGMITVPLYDTSKMTVITSMFFGCKSLKIVPALDFRSCTKFNSFLYDCKAIEEVWIKNIKANIQISDGRTWGHLLTVESLIHLIRELRDTGSAKTLTMGSINLEKLANTYVRLIDITDTMRQEDDLIDEKLPFEICNSTDDGAMLITEYPQLKNWQLA